MTLRGSLVKLGWSVRRLEARIARRLIEWLIKRYRWHNTVLGTSIPNVGCLKVKSITVVNSYGQERVHEIRTTPHTGFWEPVQ